MWIYLSLMILFVFASCHNSCSKSKLYFSGFILFALMGFKSNSIGNDTASYIELYDRLKNMSTMFDETSRFEKGYQIYNKLIGYFFEDSQALFIITAIICISCIVYGIIRSSRNWQYSLFLFVGLRFYYFFLSGLRQSIAVCIIFVAYTFLKEKKIIQYILLVAFASTFHFSAFIFIFAWPLSKMKFDLKSVGKILIVTIFIYVFFKPVLNTVLRYLPSYYSHYLFTEATSENNLANFIGVVIPCTFLIFAYFTNYLRSAHYNREAHISYNNKKIGLYNKDADVQLLFLVVSGALSLIATRASILDRMIQYYYIFSIISIPNILFSIKDRRKRTLWFIIITFFVIVYNITLLILRPEWNIIVPYRFFWQYK